MKPQFVDGYLAGTINPSPDLPASGEIHSAPGRLQDCNLDAADNSKVLFRRMAYQFVVLMAPCSQELRRLCELFSRAPKFSRIRETRPDYNYIRSKHTGNEPVDYLFGLYFFEQYPLSAKVGRSVLLQRAAIMGEFMERRGVQEALKFLRKGSVSIRLVRKSIFIDATIALAQSILTSKTPRKPSSFNAVSFEDFWTSVSANKNLLEGVGIVTRSSGDQLEVWVLINEDLVMKVDYDFGTSGIELEWEYSACGRVGPELFLGAVKWA